VELISKEEGHRQPLAPEFVSVEDFSPLEVAYDFGRVRREDIEAGPRNIWRYKKLLPVPSNVEEIPNTEPGCTKLVRADRLAKALGLKRVWVKDDTGNPTHSFKDRVVAVALAAAREFGFDTLACPPPATWRTPSPPRPPARAGTPWC
jgi:threonine synthase